MKRVSIAEAKTHLSELVTSVAEGGDVMITRRNKPIVRLVPADAIVRKARKAVDVQRLKDHLSRLKDQGEPVAESEASIRDWRYGAQA